MTIPTTDNPSTSPPRRSRLPWLPEWLRPDHPLVRDIPMPRRPALHLIFGITAGIVAGFTVNPRIHDSLSSFQTLFILSASLSNILILILALAALLMLQRDITSGRWHALRADYAAGQIIRARFVALGYQKSWLVALWLSQKLTGNLIVVINLLPIISTYSGLPAGSQMLLNPTILTAGLQLVLSGPDLVLSLLITAASGFLAAILTTNRWGGFLLTVIIIMIQRLSYAFIDPIMFTVSPTVFVIVQLIFTGLFWGVLTAILLWRARRL